MKKYFFFFFFYFVVATSYGQTKKLIIGYWEIASVKVEGPNQSDEEWKKLIQTCNETILKKAGNLGRYGIYNWLFEADNHLELYYGSEELEESVVLQYRLIDNKGKEDKNGSIVVVLIQRDGRIFKRTDKLGPYKIVSISSDELVLTDMNQKNLEDMKGNRFVLYYKRANMVSDSIMEQDTIKSVQIGEQVWMVKNLNVSKFRNGDSIPEMKSMAEWQKAGKKGKPAWCNYNNVNKRGLKYGKLYNWYAVNDPRGLAPEGWHIPSKDEFLTLQTTVKDNSNVLKALGQGYGTGLGNNTSGFSALLAGYRMENGFQSLRILTYFWSSTEYTDSYYAAYSIFIDNSGCYIWLGEYGRELGFSIRCVKD